MIVIKGDRKPVGRPSTGITKKVSLTLLPDEWKEIEEFGQTPAAYIKHLQRETMQLKEQIEQLKQENEQLLESHKNAIEQLENNMGNLNSSDYSRNEALSRWDIELSHDDEIKGEQYSIEEIESAKKSFFNILYPKDSDNAVTATKTQYICPFTGKRFSSLNRLVAAAIPLLLRWSRSNFEHEKNRKMRATLEAEEKQKVKEKWDRIANNRSKT
ncbi:hypothetical protein [Paenibacillus alvei]|uniref:Uncharacterized protein n=1 Tax=Paenibacillus alvei TaxID=44250 RepID=A0AAP7A3I5_PAEAL|nr:hypothetical protein [Paenibacillus alvei]NOJ73580.1 hypothetical protein [Paenibacillus alvei]